MADQAGQLELNVIMPLIAYNLIHSMEILGNTLAALTERYIKGITVLPHRCLAYAEGSLGLITALDLYIGYLNAGAVAKEFLESAKSLRQIVLERGRWSSEELTKVLYLIIENERHAHAYS